MQNLTTFTMNYWKITTLTSKTTYPVCVWMMIWIIFSWSYLLLMHFQLLVKFLEILMQAWWKDFIQISKYFVFSRVIWTLWQVVRIESVIEEDEWAKRWTVGCSPNGAIGPSKFRAGRGKGESTHWGTLTFLSAVCVCLSIEPEIVAGRPTSHHRHGKDRQRCVFARVRSQLCRSFEALRQGIRRMQFFRVY